LGTSSPTRAPPCGPGRRLHQAREDAHRPIIFLTVVQGIAHMGDLKKVGRVGAKGILYFEVFTTVALAIGSWWPTSSSPGPG